MANSQSTEQQIIGQRLESAGNERDKLEVRLSRELVSLLSEQLYSSPLKAIEELVVNAFDADASICRVQLPEVLGADADAPIVVFDDGVGMDVEGLRDLWHIGHSSKRDAEVEQRRKRTQIGKFGIGKLATYAIARHITYVTRTGGGPVLCATLDYEAFGENPTGGGDTVELDVVELNVGAMRADAELVQVLEEAGIDVDALWSDDAHWTIVLLEHFKSKVAELARGRLRWVLATAMPLRADFVLVLDGEEIQSSKQSYEEAVRFTVGELPQSRLDDLSEATDDTWTTDATTLRSETFPEGITGDVVLTVRTLTEGKSSDLRRSHGFFVRVRDRLVNLDDPLFGLNPLSHQTFNRFRADVDADDLDRALTAPRESVESTSAMREAFEMLLGELFYEGRARYDKLQRDREAKEQSKREHDRNYVAPELIERPVADALSEVLGDLEEVQDDADLGGADADEQWFYITLTSGTRIQELLRGLYGDEREATYSYERSGLGETGRMVRFDPSRSAFVLNVDHPVVRAHDDESAARPLLEDLVTAEVLLEVYLREQRLPARQVGEILERRDRLMRSLTKDRVYSLANIAADLRDAGDDEHDLEAALVTACRALGFVSKHIAGSDEPDGIARLTDNRAGEHKMTLEAKSSTKVPGLGAIDFATLARHRNDHGANACLLLAPRYPGSTKGEDAAAAKMAEDNQISCWTVAQLADVLAQAERRHISARQVFDICRTTFSPDVVAAAVHELLTDPDWDQRALYTKIIEALRTLEDRLPGTPRQVAHVHVELSADPNFHGTREEDVRRAVGDLSGASQGALVLRGDQVMLNTSIDEVTVRVGALLGSPGEPRRPSTFRTTSS
jgi:hypothetical protein